MMRRTSLKAGPSVEVHSVFTATSLATLAVEHGAGAAFHLGAANRVQVHVEAEGVGHAVRRTVREFLRWERPGPAAVQPQYEFDDVGYDTGAFSRRFRESPSYLGTMPIS